MKLISNLHHSDTCSGTVIVDSNGAEYRAHWTEGDSDVVICEGGLRGGIVGVIRADGATSAAEWEDLKEILAAPGENARAMTAEEEADWQGATGAAV
jgi:hypothetical protein